MAFAVPANALQCVPFAREVSGISIRGDAWTWWSAAAGTYDRGQAPKIGAVVVFKKHGSMRYGHVAVVTRVTNSREVLVDHANWAPRRTGGRGQISKMVRVTDVSPRNDWTQVRVWNSNTQDLGTKTYPTYGFIYPQGGRAHVQQAAYSAASAAAPRSLRLSQPGDPVLATADQQIAAALDSNTLPVAVEVKPLDAKSEPAKIVEAKLDTKPAAAPAEGAWEGDAAAAKTVGSGRY